MRSLERDWNDLHARALDPGPFLSFDWLNSWWSAFSRPEWLMRCLALRLDGELMGVAPCYIVEERRHARRVSVLRFWADPHSNRVNLLLSREGAGQVCSELVRRLVTGPDMTWQAAKLEPVVVDDQTTTLLVRALRDHGLPHGFDAGYSSPFRTLPSTWNDLQSSLSKSFRKTVHRQVNKGERNGLSWQLHYDCSSLPDLFAISETTWQHTHGSGLGSSPEVRRFYEAISKTAESAGSLRLAMLYKNEQPIAFELNLVERDTMFNLKVGYDPSFAALSPGLVLRCHVLRDAVESGMMEFDFLGASEKYKLHWTDTTRPHGTIFAARREICWRLYFLLRYRLKEVLEHHAPWVLHLKRRIQR